MQPTTTATESGITVGTRLHRVVNDRFESSEEHLNSVKKYLTENTNVDVDALDEYGCTALHYAADKGYIEIVNFLLEKGAKPDIVNKEGKSALMFAADKGLLDKYNQIVTSLLEKGANPDIINKEGNSALILATLKSHAGVVDSLLEAGADVNLINRKGESALTLAAFEGRVEVVDSLLKAGADFSCMPSDGFCKGITAIEIVAQKTSPNQEKIFEKLYEMGATLQPNFLNDKTKFISYDMKIFVEEHNAPEKIEERDKNLLVNKAFQDALKKSILAGKPITFRDNVVDKMLLNALKSITAEELAKTNEKNLDKLKESGVHPLLQIKDNLLDDEIILSAKNLKDFKVISDKISILNEGLQPTKEVIEAYGKDLASKLVESRTPIRGLNDNIISMILTESFSEFHKVFGKDLTSKLVSNLSEIPPSQVKKQEVDPVSPLTQSERPSSNMQCRNFINLLANKLYTTMFGSPTEDKVGVNSAAAPVQNEQPSSSPKPTGCFNFMAMFSRSSR